MDISNWLVKCKTTTATKQQKMKSIVIIFILLGVSLGVPVDIPKINDLPSLDPYQPEKSPNVPIKLGHRSKFLFFKSAS